MPYKSGSRLGGERASKLGHLDVIESEHVKDLIAAFEYPEPNLSGASLDWHSFESSDGPLSNVFAVDGSLSIISSEDRYRRELAFVKTALVRLDQKLLESVDYRQPHPMMLRDIMRESALFHATVFPLRNIRLRQQSNVDSVRRIVFDSFQDPRLDGVAMEVLRWLAYEEWDGEEKSSPRFQCPHCYEESAGLAFGRNKGACSACGKEVFLTDMIGFHLEFGDADSANHSIATAYMLIFETMMLFAGIMRFYKAGKRDLLSRCLFLKDGPLTLRGQYSKLVIPIRRFFEHAKKEGLPIHVAGQEKSGAFVDHLATIQNQAPNSSYLLLGNKYIREEIQRQPSRGEPYGSRTNYGNKVLVKVDGGHALVLSVPTGEYVDLASPDQLIGFDRILDTVKAIRSARFEGALVPIELANGVASLSTYPSSSVLRLFAGFS